jgi:hypothetical protein
VLEKGRQTPATDIAVLVDGCVQHSAAIILIPHRVIRPSPKERYSKRRSTDDHAVSLLITTDGLLLLFQP